MNETPDNPSTDHDHAAPDGAVRRRRCNCTAPRLTVDYLTDGSANVTRGCKCGARDERPDNVRWAQRFRVDAYGLVDVTVICHGPTARDWFERGDLARARNAADDAITDVERSGCPVAADDE